MITLNTGLGIGEGCPVRVNCNVGCNSVDNYTEEVKKLRWLKEADLLPDMMMDLSLTALNNPIYRTIRDELQLPFGTVLSYWGFDKENGLQWLRVKDELVHLCEEGVAFVTIHFTADVDLLDVAKCQRIIPMTSRGGGITLYDTQLNHRNENVFREHIDEIASIVKKNNVVVSLGTTFRPATIMDACDDVHIEETYRQLQICKYLRERKVQVMVENVGHISLDKIKEHTGLLKQFNTPIMPLGPLPTDAAMEQDHVANAIGAAFAASMGLAHVINCVTRYEHSKSEITLDATAEAVRTARIAAHVADLSRGLKGAWDMDKVISKERSDKHSCFVDGTACTRCSTVCPLKLNLK